MAKSYDPKNTGLTRSHARYAVYQSHARFNRAIVVRKGDVHGEANRYGNALAPDNPREEYLGCKNLPLDPNDR